MSYNPQRNSRLFEYRSKLWVANRVTPATASCLSDPATPDIPLNGVSGYGSVWPFALPNGGLAIFQSMSSTDESVGNLHGSNLILLDSAGNRTSISNITDGALYDAIQLADRSILAVSRRFSWTLTERSYITPIVLTRLMPDGSVRSYSFDLAPTTTGMPLGAHYMSLAQNRRTGDIWLVAAKDSSHVLGLLVIDSITFAAKVNKLWLGVYGEFPSTKLVDGVDSMFVFSQQWIQPDLGFTPPLLHPQLTTFTATDPDHYTERTLKEVEFNVAQNVACIDRQGNPIFGACVNNRTTQLNDTVKVWRYRAGAITELWTGPGQRANAIASFAGKLYFMYDDQLAVIRDDSYIPPAPPPVEPPLVTGFTYSPVGARVPVTITFTDTTPGPIATRRWDFGDGIKLVTRFPSITHRYTVKNIDPGYLVTLNNGVGTASQRVKVYQPIRRK